MESFSRRLNIMTRIMQEKKKMKEKFPVAGIHFENKHIQQQLGKSSWERVKRGFSFEI